MAERGVRGENIRYEKLAINIDYGLTSSVGNTSCDYTNTDHWLTPAYWAKATVRNVFADSANCGAEIDMKMKWHSKVSPSFSAPIHKDTRICVHLCEFL